MVDPFTHNNVYYNHLHHSSWHSWDGPIFIFFDILIKRILIHIPQHPVLVMGFLCFVMVLHFAFNTRRTYQKIVSKLKIIRNISSIRSPQNPLKIL